MPFVRGERAGLLPALVRLATSHAQHDRRWLRGLQRRLACDAAPLMRYNAPGDVHEAHDCPTPAARTVDAFGMLVRHVQAHVIRGRARTRASVGRRRQASSTAMGQVQGPQ